LKDELIGRVLSWCFYDDLRAQIHFLIETQTLLDPEEFFMMMISESGSHGYGSGYTTQPHLGSSPLEHKFRFLLFQKKSL
jgi:hypothetical protein